MTWANNLASANPTSGQVLTAKKIGNSILGQWAAASDGGGVNKLIAGTNVTLTPITGVGTVKVSATAGSTPYPIMSLYYFAGSALPTITTVTTAGQGITRITWAWAPRADWTYTQLKSNVTTPVIAPTITISSTATIRAGITSYTNSMSVMSLNITTHIAQTSTFYTKGVATLYLREIGHSGTDYSFQNWVAGPKQTMSFTRSFVFNGVETECGVSLSGGVVTTVTAIGSTAAPHVSTASRSVWGNILTWIWR